MVSVERPPDHVLAAFGLTGVRPVPLGPSWEGGWRCGEVVLSARLTNNREVELSSMVTVIHFSEIVNPGFSTFHPG